MRHAPLYILAGIIIGGNAALLIMLIMREAPPANKDALMLALGAFLAALGSVVNYFFGSSKGSADKTDALLNKQQPP